MHFNFQSVICGLVLFLSLAVARSADVLTYHNDLARTGLNASETVLTPANVGSNTFGKVLSFAVDGQIYAQPLYLSLVSIPQKGVRSVVYVATEHDSVFAFDVSHDAEPSAAPLWQVSFIDPAHGVTTVPDEDVTGLGSIAPEIGITSTPVLDPASGTIYVVAKSKEKSSGAIRFVQRLHALDVATGAEKFGGPVAIDAVVPGKGDGTDGLGRIPFNPRTHLNRPGLVLANRTVYACWASHGDTCPYHGWIIGYDALTLRQQAAFNTTPNGGLGGIWQSGGAPAADAGGNLYVITGNGSFDASEGGSNYGDTFLKLAPDLSVADYFTPYNQAQLEANDTDLGSSGAMLLPREVGGGKDLLIGAGKEGTIYLLDTHAMGHFQPAGDTQIVQSLTNAIGLAFGTPAYWNGLIYYAAVNDYLKAFAVSAGHLNPVAVMQTSRKLGYPGATPSISASGTNNAIIWLIEREDRAVLHAFDARDLSRELYNSAQAGLRDASGPAIKFSVPTVADGQVFVGTADRLDVFGLLSPVAGRARSPRISKTQMTVPPPQLTPLPGPYSGPVDVVITNPNDETEVRYTLDGTDPADYSPVPDGPLHLKQSAVIKAAAFSAEGRSQVISGIYDINELAAHARFLLPDVTSRGNWVGSYGANGHHVLADAPNYPERVPVSFRNADVFVFSTVSADSRTLQKAFCPDERISAVWYSATKFSIDVDVMDRQVQLITFYCVDTSDTRAQKIEVVDAWSGRVLDTRTLQHFTNGIYLGWEVTGHVQFVITPTAGANAVVSGLFVDPVARRPALHIELSGTNAIVSWPVAAPDFHLERAASLSGPFTPLSQPTNTSQIVPVDGGTQFFRLRREQP